MDLISLWMIILKSLVILVFILFTVVLIFLFITNSPNFQALHFNYPYFESVVSLITLDHQLSTLWQIFDSTPAQLLRLSLAFLSSLLHFFRISVLLHFS